MLWRRYISLDPVTDDYSGFALAQSSFTDDYTGLVQLGLSCVLAHPAGLPTAPYYHVSLWFGEVRWNSECTYVVKAALSSHWDAWLLMIGERLEAPAPFIAIPFFLLVINLTWTIFASFFFFNQWWFSIALHHSCRLCSSCILIFTWSLQSPNVSRIVKECLY